MKQADLHALEASVNALLQAFDEVCTENTALRNQQTNLISERAALIEKSELARSRVESMIARLKAMEIGQ
ncbi:MAG: TIGR02449 family protein [Gammaproteobacteria bacterium]|nr:MAG: TIGR02449 family protein [Gammaproteobacteria bacterium]